MREYLRRSSSEGWIINLSPEGHRPDVATRLFPGVQQPLAIGLFVRRPDVDLGVPAPIHYTEVSGRRAEKYEALSKVALAGNGWRDARSAWQAPLTPAADSAWDEWPAMDDLMPWTAPGVKPNRTWVYSPDPEVLAERWRQLIAAPGTGRGKLMEGTEVELNATPAPLPGGGGYDFATSLADEDGEAPQPVRVGYRAFDRQFIVPDSRLINRPRPPLWSARRPGQVFVIEQSALPISGGPGLIFSALIPDMHAFNNRGGRTLPLLHPDGSANLAPGLLAALQSSLGLEAAPAALDLVSYLAAVVAHPAFTASFDDELSTPGVRVPLTRDPDLWRDAVALGRQVLWLHTFGAACAASGEGRPAGNVRYPTGDPRQPLARKAVQSMPEAIDYDEKSLELRLGSGVWGPVRPEVWSYEVGGRGVIESWFNYRKATPAGRRTARTSPLADIHTRAWPTEWTIELIDVLTVLSRLVELEPEQETLMGLIASGELLSSEGLQEKGVSWPAGRADRRPRMSIKAAGGFDFGSV